MQEMQGLDDLRGQGGMDWLEEEKGWVAAPDDVVGALAKDGFAASLDRDPYRDDGGEG